MSTKKKHYGDILPSKLSDIRYQSSTFSRVATIHGQAASKTSSKQQKSGKSLSLISFIRKYSSALPIRVCVVEGYSGKSDRYITVLLNASYFML